MHRAAGHSLTKIDLVLSRTLAARFLGSWYNVIPQSAYLPLILSRSYALNLALV